MCGAIDPTAGLAAVVLVEVSVDAVEGDDFGVCDCVQVAEQEVVVSPFIFNITMSVLLSPIVTMFLLITRLIILHFHLLVVGGIGDNDKLLEFVAGHAVVAVGDPYFGDEELFRADSEGQLDVHGRG